MRVVNRSPNTYYNEKTKVWSSFDPERSPGHHLLTKISQHGLQLAQINGITGVETTYDQLWLKSVRAAQNLQNRGFEPRQVFTFMTGDCDNVAPLVFAAFCLGCPINPLHPMHSKDELTRILKKTKPSAVFCDKDSYTSIFESITSIELNIPIFTFGGKIYDSEPVENLFAETGVEQDFEPIITDPDNDIAGIFCSSGTTGPHKNVSVSYANLDHVFPSILNDVHGVGLSFDSIYWTFGVSFLMHCVNVGAVRIVTPKSFTPGLMFKLVQEYKVTCVQSNTLSLIACLKSDTIKKMDLSSIKELTFHGCKMPLSLVDDIHQYFGDAKVASVYATAEIGGICIGYEDSWRTGYAGHLLYGFNAKIVDEHGNRCGPYTSGEICVRSKHKFLGYYDDPEETASTVDSDGYILTDDIGHFDLDGHLFINDRKTDTIKTFYFRKVIMPSEFEEFLMLSPDIKDACVVGIPVPNDLTSIPAAVIIKNANSSLTEENVYEMIAEKFSFPARLRGGVYFVNSLPRTHSGKIIRRKVADIASYLFKLAKYSDPDIKSYLSDYPEEFRKFI